MEIFSTLWNFVWIKNKILAIALLLIVISHWLLQKLNILDYPSLVKISLLYILPILIGLSIFTIAYFSLKKLTLCNEILYDKKNNPYCPNCRIPLTHRYLGTLKCIGLRCQKCDAAWADLHVMSEPLKKWLSKKSC